MDEVALADLGVKDVAGSVYYGAQPKDERFYSQLRDLGFRSIISVDGKPPDLATAKKYQLKCVHLPMGYSKLTNKQEMDLGKAVRDLAGKIYVHCHHGRHRAPIAAIVGCVIAGELDPSRVDQIIKEAGTNAVYVGLISSARSAEAVSEKRLDEHDVNFTSSAPVKVTARLMSAMANPSQRLFDWSERLPVDTSGYGDLAKEADSLVILESLKECMRASGYKIRSTHRHQVQADGDYSRLLTDAFQLSKKVHDSFQANTRNRGEDIEKHSRPLVVELRGKCATCHEEHR